MNKIFNKIISKIILIIGLILLTVVFSLNMLFEAIKAYNPNEHVQVIQYGIKYLFLSILIALIIYVITCIINYFFKSKNTKTIITKIIYISLLLAYIIISLTWVYYINGKPVYDQRFTYNTAVLMFDGSDSERLMHNEYLEIYPQQLPTAAVWSIIFKIFGKSNLLLLQFLNIISNVITIITIIKIIELLSNKYKTNKYLGFILIFTFIPLILLTTFIYGDEVAIALSLVAILFIMKYGAEEKIKNKILYLIISSLSMALAYCFRMNSLIIILAIAIYIFLLMLNTKNLKDIAFKFMCIIVFVSIAILPGNSIKSYYQDKYELNKNYALPSLSWILIGISENEKDTRASGWYNETIAQYLINNRNSATEISKDMIITTLKHFTPASFISFYFEKETSMWTENTNDSLWHNQSFNKGWKKTDENIAKDNKIQSTQTIVIVYQKALILLIFGLTIIVLIQNRNNISNEMLLLLMIFIGGFLFHTIWEAKSRYILPYIIVLIPLASIEISNFKIKHIKNTGEKNEV